MKWMLVVLVFEVAPMKTNLIFDDLNACLAAEEVVRGEYARAYNARRGEPPNVAQERFMEYRLLRNSITCIPHAAPVSD